MKQFIIAACLIAIISFTGCSQTPGTSNSSKAKLANPTGNNIGGCDGCEVIYQCPVAFNKLPAVNTLPDFNEQGPKMQISGTIYEHDGKTPAKDVVLYIYHTDQAGHYTNKGNNTGLLKRNGYIHSWIKTGKDGRYSFNTLRPGVYPERNAPAHIHAIIKEASGINYWIDEYLFDDDPLLTNYEKSKQENRGGSGIIHLSNINGKWSGIRNVTLGLNVPGYAQIQQQQGLQSGLAIGTPCPAFGPRHISGADAGTKACPMCKYGYGQGLMIWFNHADLNSMDQFAQTLEKEMRERGEKKLRVFLICINSSYNNNATDLEKLQQEIKKWCDEQNLQKVAVVCVPSPVDEETCRTYNINPSVKNTVFLYKKRVVVAKWININYSDQSIQTMLQQL